MDSRTLFALIILFLPLASFVFQIFFGKKVGPKGVWISVAAIGVTFVLAISMLFTTVTSGITSDYFPVVQWFTVGEFSLDLGFQLDNLALAMLVIVQLIAFLVHLYSVEYMRGDIRYTRYFGFLGIFTFSMNGIVLSQNLIMMYLFWELVGLSSYLLIGHWFEKEYADFAS